MKFGVYFWKNVFIILPTFIIDASDNTFTLYGGWCAWGFIVKITH